MVGGHSVLQTHFLVYIDNGILCVLVRIVSNENTQYAFILKKIEKLFLLCHLTSRCNQPHWLELPCLELIFMVPKVFKPLKFDSTCITMPESQKDVTTMMLSASASKVGKYFQMIVLN